MPSTTLTTPVEIVGIKNISGAQVNPARTEDIVSLPAAQFDQIVAMMQHMLQAMQVLVNADASNRLRVAVESSVGITATIASGTITNNVGVVRVEEAGGFGLRNIQEASELRRETMDVAFNTQLSQLVFTS